MTWLITFVVFAVAICAMALGVMLAGRRLQGSCGGVGGGSCACGPEKRARCERAGSDDQRPEGERRPVARHADAPIEAHMLTKSRPS